MRILTAKSLPLIIAFALLLGWTYDVHAAELSPALENSKTIHVVTSGDSLYNLARQYSTDIKTVKELNGLKNDTLYSGQALELPGYSQRLIDIDPDYNQLIVSAAQVNIRKGPGFWYDTVNTLEKGARLPVTAYYRGWYRVQIYNETQGWVSAGVVNKLPVDPTKPVKSVVGYYTDDEGYLSGSYESFTSNTSQMTALAPFWFRFKMDEPTVIEPFGKFNQEEALKVINEAHRKNLKVMPVIHNLLYGKTGAGRDVVHQMVANRESRKKAIDNIITLTQEYGFDGVNIDIEYVYLEDRSKLNSFYQELGQALRENNLTFTVSVPAKTFEDYNNKFSAPFDYKVIGEHADQVMIMMYNEHGFPGSGAGPVTSTGFIESVVKFAATQMPSEKIITAIPVFGFDFNLDTDKYRYISYEMAMETAEYYGVQPQFDIKGNVPVIKYTDEKGQKHEIWYENARSLGHKLDLLQKYNLAGAALWRIGMEDSAGWPVIKEKLVIK